MAEWVFDFCGGHLAVDFANTLSERLTAAPEERLVEFADLVEFGRQSDVLSAREAARLKSEANLRQADAAAALRDAVALREALYDLFYAVAEQTQPKPADLMVLNAQLPRLRLNASYDWEWSSSYGGLDQLLGLIVRAAVDLLTAGPRHRIRVCKADDCAWLFLDSSKNRSRKWCDMSNCGNRAKVRRFHARQRGAL